MADSPEVARIRERHVPHEFHGAPGDGPPLIHCDADNHPWPCDTAIVLQALDELTANGNGKAHG